LLADVFKHVAQNLIEVVGSGRREDESTAHALRFTGDDAEAVLSAAA
jgi:hypothetical protein